MSAEVSSPFLPPHIPIGPPHHRPSPPPGLVEPAVSSPHPRLDAFPRPFRAIVDDLHKEYIIKPSAASYIKAIHALKTDELRILAKEATNIQPLTLQERRSFINGAREGLASADGQSYMEEAATAAGEACAAIKDLFSKLSNDLKDIDERLEATGEQVAPFEPLLKPLRLKYNTIIADCKTLSSKVSKQGREFKSSIIAFATADDLDTTAKVARIQKYIDKANTLSQDSAKIQADLSQLQKDFSRLMERFHDFSKKRQPNFHAKIESVRQRLEDLEQKLKDLKLQLTVVTASAGVVGTLATALAGIFAPAAAFILAGGLLATAGLGVYAAIVAAQVEEIERDKKAAQGQLSQLTAADAAYKEATTALEQLRRDNDETFTTSIDLVLKLLRNVTTDAEAIKDWLLTAGDDEALPEVMGTDLQEAGKIYEAMSQYLDEFENRL